MEGYRKIDIIERKILSKRKIPPSRVSLGKTHSITGLNINSVSDNQGLFGYIENATRPFVVELSTAMETLEICGFCHGVMPL